MGGRKKDYARGVIKFTSRALLVAIFALVTLMAVQGIFSPFHVVKGDSMSPGIQKGDAITIREVNPINVEIGQVVVYSGEVNKKEVISVNRVVDLKQYGRSIIFYANGDTDPAAEPVEVSAAAIVGSPSFNIPKLGYLLDFIVTPVCFITCILLMGAASLMLMHVCAKIDDRSVNSARRSRVNEQKEMIACTRSFV